MHFEKYQNLRLPYVGLFESRTSKRRQLKSMLYANDFILRLFWSTSSHFVAIHSWIVHCSETNRHKSQKRFFKGLRLLTFISADSR